MTKLKQEQHSPTSSSPPRPAHSLHLSTTHTFNSPQKQPHASPASPSQLDPFLSLIPPNRHSQARDAAQIFNKAPGEVSKAERDVGKTINFATIYGQGATALAQQLKVERKEAQRYIDDSLDQTCSGHTADNPGRRLAVVAELPQHGHYRCCTGACDSYRVP